MILTLLLLIVLCSPALGQTPTHTGGLPTSTPPGGATPTPTPQGQQKYWLPSAYNNSQAGMDVVMHSAEFAVSDPEEHWTLIGNWEIRNSTLADIQTVLRLQEKNGKIQGEQISVVVRSGETYVWQVIRVEATLQPDAYELELMVHQNSNQALTYTTETWIGVFDPAVLDIIQSGGGGGGVTTFLTDNAGVNFNATKNSPTSVTHHLPDASLTARGVITNLEDGSSQLMKGNKIFRNDSTNAFVANAAGVTSQNFSAFPVSGDRYGGISQLSVSETQGYASGVGHRIIAAQTGDANLSRLTGLEFDIDNFATTGLVAQRGIRMMLDSSGSTTQDGIAFKIESMGGTYVRKHGLFSTAEDVTHTLGGPLRIGCDLYPCGEFVAPVSGASLDMHGASGALVLPNLETVDKDNLTQNLGAVVYDNTVHEIQGFDGVNWLNLGVQGGGGDSWKSFWVGAGAFQRRDNCAYPALTFDASNFESWQVFCTNSVTSEFQVSARLPKGYKSGTSIRLTTEALGQTSGVAIGVTAQCGCWGDGEQLGLPNGSPISAASTTTATNQVVYLGPMTLNSTPQCNSDDQIRCFVAIDTLASAADISSVGFTGATISYEYGGTDE